MVSVPRGMLPVELWTARGRKALQRLGIRPQITLIGSGKNGSRKDAEAQREAAPAAVAKA
jgi:hypothetical protein